MGAGLPIEVLNADGAIVQTLTFHPPEHVAQPLIQLIVDELLGNRDTVCPATSDNAIRISEVLYSILNSFYGGRHDEFWSRKDTWPGVTK